MSTTTRRPGAPGPQPTPVKRPQPTPVNFDEVKDQAIDRGKDADKRQSPPARPSVPKPKARSAPAPTPTPVATTAGNGRAKTPRQPSATVKRAPKHAVKRTAHPASTAAPKRPPRTEPKALARADAAPARIDPRIKRRRIEVTRDAGRRRLRVVLGSLGGVALIAAGVGATRSPLLDVDRVELVGAEHTALADVTKAGHLDDRPQLLDVNTGALARRVERLPWVAEAHASRHWPSTVKVVVTERTIAASLPAQNGKWAVADGTGRVLALSDGRPDAMPSILGAEVAGEPGTTVGRLGRTALRVAAALPFDIRSMTVELEVATTGDIDLRMREEGRIRLGDTSLLEEKLQAAETVLATIKLKDMRVLDVRVPRAPVLTRR